LNTCRVAICFFVGSTYAYKSLATSLAIVLFVSVDREDRYVHFPPEGVFANCLSLFMGLIVFFGIFLVANIDFRRLPSYVDEKI